MSEKNLATIERIIRVSEVAARASELIQDSYRQCLKNIAYAIAKSKKEPLPNLEDVSNEVLEKTIQSYNGEITIRATANINGRKFLRQWTRKSSKSESYPTWIKTQKQRDAWDRGCEWFDNHKHDDEI